MINNAGETIRTPLETVPVSEVARLFDLNTLGALRVVQAVLPDMRERLVQPGAVTTNGSAKVKVYRTDHDPYGPLFDELVKARREVVTPEEVATVVADTIEQENPPLRVTAGAPAAKVLAARKASPENEIFLPDDINW